ncbi:MAG: hypothetical protein NXI20_06540 [bacterium]|nr:hypothetical protein [bacterium]
MIRTLICSTLFAFISCLASAQDNPLSKFDNLMNKTWVAEGTWGDGSKFKQEMSYSYGLGEQIVIAKSKGFINQDATEFGDRNHGIRKFDKESGKYLFWEFDVFGGTTTGEILFQDNSVIYVYEYGGSVISDVWKYVDEKTYDYSVGNWVDGKQSQVYLKTQFVLKED